MAAGNAGFAALVAWCVATHFGVSDVGPGGTRRDLSLLAAACAAVATLYAHKQRGLPTTSAGRAARFAAAMCGALLLFAAGQTLRAVAEQPQNRSAAGMLFVFSSVVALAVGLPLTSLLLAINLLVGSLLAPSGTAGDWLGRGVRRFRAPIGVGGALLAAAFVANSALRSHPPVPCDVLASQGAHLEGGRCIIEGDAIVKSPYPYSGLPPRLTVRGGLTVHGCSLDELGQGLVVQGDLFLYKSCIRALPADLVVDGKVDSYLGFGDSMLRCRDLPKSIKVRDGVRCED
jgi:hypothetical protein